MSGKSVKVWTNYEGGQLIDFRAENKSKWNIAATAVDRKGRLWYKIGYSEWIEARYTEDLDNKKAGQELPSVHAIAKKVKKHPKINSLKSSKDKNTKSQQHVHALKNDSKANVSKLIPAGATSASLQRAQAVVDLAKSEVGKGYAWGGNGPDNFDCSGLVQYVYNKVGGITLPRVTIDQVKVGTTVQMDQLQPGDLLYWGSATAPYHIGIYVGNNQYISAATPDEGVVLKPISTYFYPSVAKRVL
ncbi:peptidoglycan endopeptidase [Lactobacillus sp. XV13L]|nr:peptidoglycan endopeptidase [Lactobacillus sp. XV13L]